MRFEGEDVIRRVWFEGDGCGLRVKMWLVVWSVV